MKNDKELKMLRIFLDGPSKVIQAVNEAAEFVCSDWPEGEGFGSSDRRAVYHDALRTILGAKNYLAWSRGQVEINPVEWDMFTSYANNRISEELLKSEERYAY
jgi:hypothetical protein